MSRLTDIERTQFAMVMQTISTAGPALEHSRAADRELADKMRAVLPGADDVTIGRVLHKVSIEIAMRTEEGVSAGDVAAAFTFAALDLVATDLGSDVQ
ncbi:hypothetical protein [Streptosporangium roseum]|uniref:hypothetical protein n=1 Tax=Streptosporangium roseum TaxID=2001 RepID=UPI00342C1C68